MPADNTPVWQIYGMPQPTFNQGGGEQSSNQANQSSLQPMPSFGDVKNGVGQAGKDMSIAGNLFGSDTLKGVGSALSGATQAFSPAIGAQAAGDAAAAGGSSSVLGDVIAAIGALL